MQYNVLAPGPVNLHPKVLEALQQPMIHHRTPEFDRILKRVLTNLKEIFATSQDCYILTCTGSGGMEALLVNTLSSGDKVIGIDSGKFGERWCEMAKIFSAKLIHHKVPWGEALQPQALEELLKQHPDTKIVLTQACETSTATLHPIEALGKIVARYPDCLFLVDGITALGAMPLPMDQWQIDGLVGGSQKAFMLPTGLALLSFSNKAWAKISQSQTPRYYFDIRKEKKANQNGETFFSSNVTLIRALDVVLDLIHQQGINNLHEEIKARAKFTRFMATEMNLIPFSQSPSPSLSAFLTPENIDSAKLRQKLEEKHKITIMGGQDQLKGKIIRIGHMGYITAQDQIKTMTCLADTLNDFGQNIDVNKIQKLAEGFFT